MSLWAQHILAFDSALPYYLGYKPTPIALALPPSNTRPFPEELAVGPTSYKTMILQ